MAISETNRTVTSYAPEVTYGVVPTAQLQKLRVTSNSLVENSTNVVSAEIRSDRNIIENIQVAASAGGDLGFEFSNTTYNDLFEGLLCNDFATAVTETASTISIVDTAGNLTIEDSGAGFTAADWPVGKWVKVSGFTTTNTGVHYAIVSGTATTSVIPVISATLAAEAAGDSVTIKNDGMLRNGTSSKSFTIQKEYEDLTQFFYWVGAIINSGSLAINAESLLSGSFGIMAKSEAKTTSSVGTGAYLDETSTKILNATSNVVEILDGSDAAAWYFTQFGLDVSNNAEMRPAVGELNPISVGLRSFTTNATASIYYDENDTFYAKYKAQSQNRFAFRFTDADGKTTIFTIHKAKVTSMQIPTGAKDADHIANISLGGEYDPTTGCTLQIDVFA